MRRETDVNAGNYTAERAILALSSRYGRIYQTLGDRRYVVVTPDGINAHVVTESGLYELARVVEFAEALSLPLT